MLWTVAVSCEQETLVSDAVFVDPNLQTYFDSFESAAKVRGIEVDLSSEGISAFLLSINEGSVIGKCSSKGDNKTITIDSDFWRSASHFERELVVFHELGHCYLQRNHLDTANGDGTCKSMMHSGLTDCRSNYNSLTRTRYLDELFK